MPRLTPLPVQLRYLQPFRKQVARLKADEIDESMDLSLLNTLLLNRIAGMSLEDGKRLLQQDQAALEKWLSIPDLEDNGGMSFLRGYLMGLPELAECLLEEKDKRAGKQVELFMDLSCEAKITKRADEELWEVRWLRARMWVSVVSKDLIETELRNYLDLARTPFIDVTVIPVAFGSVGGIKKITRRAECKSPEFDYALQVPGGYVSVGLVGSRAGLDECQFEQCFHTIRIGHP